jgi:hypothetical protein
LSKPSQRSQANAFPSQIELNNNWTKVSYKRGRSAQDKTEIRTKRNKDSEYWLSHTSTSNRYTTLLQEENEDQQHKTGPENTPKPPIYIKGDKNISPLIQPLEQYEIKALADNQVKVQSKTSEC